MAEQAANYAVLMMQDSSPGGPSEQELWRTMIRCGVAPPMSGDSAARRQHNTILAHQLAIARDGHSI